LKSLCLTAHGADLLHHLFGGLRVAGVIHRHGPTVLGSQQGGGSANTAAGASDE
jgi:hypothetical protein